MTIPIQGPVFTRNLNHPLAMSMPAKESRDVPALVVNKPPSQHPEYAALCKAWAFFEASYRGGAAYKSAKDTDGKDVFVTHELESPTGAARRRQLSTYRNYCRPTCDKFAAYVFTSSHIGRSDDPAFLDWCKDVTGYGTPLEEFVRQASLYSTILGRWFTLSDTTKSDDRTTVAQVKAAGDRMTLSHLHPARVIDWSNDFTTLLVRHDDLGKFGCVRLWTKDAVQVGILNRLGRVATIKATESLDTWKGQLPIIVWQGIGLGQSLLADVAEYSKGIFYKDSLLVEELSKQTFTSWFGIGFSAADVENLNQGARKVVCINRPASGIRLDRVAGDPSQAQSIRESIAAEEKEIYRTLGLRMPDVSAGGPESGAALKIRFTETSSIAAAVSKAAALTETQIVDLYNLCYGAAIGAPDYPNTFDDNDLTQELKNVLDTVANQFPPSLKVEAVIAYFKKAYTQLSNEERNTISAEIRAFYPEQEADMGARAASAAIPSTLPSSPTASATAQQAVKAEETDKAQPAAGAAKEKK